MNFNYKRGNGKCIGLTTNESSIRVMRISSWNTDLKFEFDEIVCGGTRKAANFDQAGLNNCVYDATPPATVYVRNTLTDNEQDSIKHAFSALSDRFGRYGK